MATATKATVTDDQTWRTIAYALKKRGYKNINFTPVTDEKQMPPKMSSKVAWWATATGDSLDNILVVRCVGTRIMKPGVSKRVREMSSLLDNQEPKNLPARLLIVADSLGFKNHYRPEMDLFEKKASEMKVPVRFLLARDVRFNALEHRLVPEHKLMSESDVNGLAKSYGFGDRVAEFKASLPKMGIYDPIAALLGGRPGDVFKIHRKGGDFAYRVVVADFGTS